MNIEEFNNYLQTIPGQIMEYVPDIVAETAVEYFKETFTKKAFDGNPWVQGRPKRRGSLLVQSGNLMNSIQPAEISPERVVISAGNPQVQYAQAHNEGVDKTVQVKERYKIKGGGKTLKGKNFSVIKAHKRKINIPKRQFMGDSAELNDIIKEKIDNLINNML